MIFATIDADGYATSFFDDRINEIPSGATEITEAQHALWLAGQRSLRWSDGALVPAPAPPAPPEPAPPTLEEVQGQLTAMQAMAERLQQQLHAMQAPSG